MHTLYVMKAEHAHPQGRNGRDEPSSEEAGAPVQAPVACDLSHGGSELPALVVFPLRQHGDGAIVLYQSLRAWGQPCGATPKLLLGRNTVAILQIPDTCHNIAEDVTIRVARSVGVTLSRVAQSSVMQAHAHWSRIHVSDRRNTKQRSAIS